MDKRIASGRFFVPSSRPSYSSAFKSVRRKQSIKNFIKKQIHGFQAFRGWAGSSIRLPKFVIPNFFKYIARTIINQKTLVNYFIALITSPARNENFKTGRGKPPKKWYPIFGYYLGFFLLLLLLPVFYWDGSDQSIFLNWVEAHELPINKSKVSTLGGANQDELAQGRGMPEVVLLSSVNNDQSAVQYQARFDGPGVSSGGEWDNNNIEFVIDPRYTPEKSIINIESTNELISEDIIGDWVDENDRNIFEVDIPNPFTEAEGRSEIAFKHRNYEVAGGDSLWSISKKFNVSIDSIVSLNKISSPRNLITGQQLLIPQLSGIYYQVKKNDSLLDIAKNYNVSIDRIKEYNSMGAYLQIGKVLFLPGGKFNRFEKDYIFGNLFALPVEGVLSSKYGFRQHPIRGKRLFHTGIDVAQNDGSRIRAAADGRVSHSGPKGGYGKYVVLRHAMGYETGYAHLAEIWVKNGQKIKKGQYIGRVGNTGLSTGPHLHFEVKQNNKFINPLRFVKY